MMKVLLLVCLRNVCHAESDQDAVKAVSQGNWEFSSSLYSALSKSAKLSDNLIFSPFSVQIILAMCYTGAGGETAKQMAKGLHLPDRPDLVNSGVQQLIKSLHSSEEVTLETANKIFPADRFPILEEFTESVQKFFSSEIENVNYSDSESAANTINDWVNKKTHGKITDVVSSDTLDPDTVMVLVNAVYFKGDWLSGFNKSKTSTEMFYVNGKDETPVDMMHLNANFDIWFNHDIGAKMVELPYKDNSTSLVIILPRELNGLPDVEAKLEKMDLKKVLEPTKQATHVSLSLPRFDLKMSTSLKDTLSVLGMTDMFERTADFSKTTTMSGVFVSSVIHKAMIEVNEEGTVAAAVTVVEYDYRSSSVLDFVADHPFAFALVSRRAGVVLFMGRYNGE